jgi:hypothetical protein
MAAPFLGIGTVVDETDARRVGDDHRVIRMLYCPRGREAGTLERDAPHPFIQLLLRERLA